jgi:hypothetical protein
MAAGDFHLLLGGGHRVGARLNPPETHPGVIAFSRQFTGNFFLLFFPFPFFLSDEKQDAKMSWPHELASHVSHTIRRPIMIPHVIYSRSN